MSVLLRIALGVFLLGAGVANAGVSPAPQLDIPFQTFLLPNGFRVILAEDHRLPLVATNLRFRVGSANDAAGRKGFAHLFEHLYAFSPPASVPSAQEVGALQDGATTDPDRTTYYVTAPSTQLETILALQSERWRHFLERLDQSLLNKERSNVRDERRLVIENQPYGLADEAIFKKLFPQGHPYQTKYVGLHRDVEAINLNELRAFFTQYYTPGNASLVIAGDIDQSRARALVEKYFGAIPAGRPVAPLQLRAPALSARVHAIVSDRIETPRVSMSWITPGWYEAGSAETELLAAVLGQNDTSRLPERLIRQRHLARSVVVEYLPFALNSVINIHATPADGVSLAQLEAAIDEEMAALRRTGPTQEEVVRARNAVSLTLVRGLEKLGEITAFGDFTGDNTYGGVAEQLNQCQHFTGSPGCLPQVVQRYWQATPRSLQKVAALLLTPQSSLVVQAVAGEKIVDDPAAVATGKQADSAVASSDAFSLPPPGPPSSVRPPVAQKFTLANGLTVLLAEQHQVPVITAQVVVRAGGGASPPDAPGLATFAAEMLVRGTRSRSSRAFAADAARLGTAVQTSSSSDAVAIGIHLMKQNLQAGLDLLADAVMNPAFPGEEIEQMRADELLRLHQLRSNADTLASYVFTNTLFGEQNAYHGSGLFNEDLFGRTHRYQYKEFGSKASLERLDRGELTEFWQREYTPANAALVVAGDISAAELRVAAERYFGKWRGAAPAGRALVAANAQAGKRIVIEDVGSASQTALRVGTLGAASNSPDAVPLHMLNFVFGEVYASRITSNLRVEHNYTYMARSQFAFRRQPGPFVIGTNVRTDVTASALQELFHEIRRIRSEPVSDADLQFARAAFNSYLIGRFETTGKMAMSLGQLFTYEMPIDYYRSLPGLINATTASDLQRVAQRYLDPSKIVVVAVGDRSRIERPILDLPALEATP